MSVTNDPEVFVGNPFDYLIVGGGTAGLAVAARLSENPDINVGVLEAGAARLNDPSILTPGAFPSLIGHEEYDWLFKTIQQVRQSQVPMPRCWGTSDQIDSLAPTTLSMLFLAVKHWAAPAPSIT